MSPVDPTTGRDPLDPTMENDEPFSHSLVYTGPTVMNCPLKCEVPAGVEMTVVPTPRHKWSDVAVCPEERCRQAFLIVKEDDVAEFGRWAHEARELWEHRGYRVYVSTNDRRIVITQLSPAEKNLGP